MLTYYLHKKAQKIKAIVTDVDGVLTDGFIFIRDDHEEPFGKFNILDGAAIKMAHESNVTIAVISGRKSLATEARCHKLGIELAYTGIQDKKSKILELAKQLAISLDEIAYIGDDLIDLPAITLVGLRFAPANAVAEVKQRVDYISNLSGGDGVLREVVELILKAQDKYNNYLAKYV